MSDVFVIIIGMMVVTYVPRVLPFYMLSGKKLPKWLDMFLGFVPYAAFGALIVPGAFLSIEGSYIAAIGGLLFAGIFSYIKGNVIASVIGGIGFTYLVLLFI